MQKTFNRIHMIIAAFLVFSLVFSFGQITKAEENYSYTVRIYSGEQGTFADGSTEITILENADGAPLSYGDQITIDTEDLGIVLAEGSKYYVRGLREAGHDNSRDENKQDTTGMQSVTLTVNEDAAYVISYAVAGNMVKYTVNYVAEDGTVLMPAKDFYGKEGDKPVVSYKYVEGYLPNAYNEAKTLSSDESANQFTFVYHQVIAPAGTDQNENGTENGEAAAGNNDAGGADGGAGAAGIDAGAGAAGVDAGAAGAGNAGAAGAGVVGGNGNQVRPGRTEPQNLVDLDNEEVPLANPNAEVPSSPQGEGASVQHTSTVWFIVGGVILAAIIVLIILLVLSRAKRRKG